MRDRVCGVAMAKVTEDPFVLPDPIADLRASGVEVFCKETFPKKVRYWPSRMARASANNPFTAVVDSAEQLQASANPGCSVVRLTTGDDVLDVAWDEAWTEVNLREHGVATFDVYVTVSVRWNGQDVLSIRMGGDSWEFGVALKIIVIKNYKPGPWLDLVGWMNGASP